MAENLLPARLQMAFTLGFHIILACFGVGLPILMLAAEWLHLRTGKKVWMTIARRWSKAFAVLFAVGAVSGTVLSFELGLLWPEFMGRFGAVIGLPFTLEGFAFFMEAIFVGIYLYGWDKLPPRWHWYSRVPVAIAGFASAAFVVTANSWMNTPQGFRMENGLAVDPQPIEAMLNPAAGAQVAHMIVAAYMVSGFCVASYYACVLLREKTNTSESRHVYHRRAMQLGLCLAAILTPVQMLIGDWSAKTVAKTQPVKLAAMESHFTTEKGAPLIVGGIPNRETSEVHYAIKIPKGLSFLAYGNPNAEVKGLDDFPREDQPPVMVVHFAFQAMVFAGTMLMALSVWIGWSLLRKRRFPSSRLFLWATLPAGLLAIIALEAGWTVTEVGRQPWIVQGVMRTHEAVTDAPGVWTVFYVTLAIYAVLAAGSIAVLRLLSRRPLPEDL